MRLISSVLALASLSAAVCVSAACTRASHPTDIDGDILEVPRGEVPVVRPLFVDKGDLPTIRERGRLRILVFGRGEDILPRAGASMNASEQTAVLLAQHLELEPELISVDNFADLLPMLLEGKGDLVAARLTVTKARQAQVAFTRAVSTIDEELIVKKGAVAPKTIAELGDLTISVRPSSSYRETLDGLKAKDAPGIVIADAPEGRDTIHLIHDVAEGKILATVADSDIAAHVQAYEPNTTIAMTLRQAREIAFAVRPDNPELKAAADAWLIERTLTSQRTRKVDFDTIKRRGSLRVLSRNNAVSYFLHKGVQQGFDHDLLALFAKEHSLRLEFIVPENASDLIPWLLEGKGDVIAASMTRTPEREAQMWMSRPYNMVEEVVVQKAGAAPLTSLADLKGKTLHVRKSSSYATTLAALQAAHGPFTITFAPEDLETEDLIGAVARGEIPLTVADSTIAAIEKAWRDDIQTSVTLGDKRSIALAARTDAPLLQQALDAFIDKHVKFDDDRVRGSLEYNMLKKQYFESARRAQESAADFKETGKLSPYDELIKEYSKKYGLDWRLMAAQAYQESRFNPEAKSWVGALGLFQVMPRTGAEMGFRNLTDPKEGVHAGVRYMSQLLDSFDKNIPFKHRMRFALASYNAGRGHVEDARRLAKEQGKDPNKWFRHVEQTMLQLENPKVYRKMRHGYCRGSEPVKYVSEISLRYTNYVSVVPNPGVTALK